VHVIHKQRRYYQRLTDGFDMYILYEKTSGPFPPARNKIERKVGPVTMDHGLNIGLTMMIEPLHREFYCT